MRRTAPILAIIFMKLERFYGKQHRSDVAYKTGWDKLSQDIGLNPRALLDAVPHERSFALDRRSMVSEVRASKVEKNAACSTQIAQVFELSPRNERLRIGSA